MRIAESRFEIQVFEDLVLKPGIKYVMAGAILRQLNRFYPGGIMEVDNFSNYYRPLFPDKLKEGSSVFMFRTGGIGDVMFMLPLIRHIVSEYKVSVNVASSPMYKCLMDNNPYVKEVFSMPFELDRMNECDFHLTFENVIESITKESASIHAVDLFLEEGGIDPEGVSNDYKIPELFISDREKELLSMRIKQNGLDREGLRLIGIQLQSSSPIRTFPIDKIISLILTLIEDDNNIIFLFGGKNQASLSEYVCSLVKDRKKIVNLPAMDIPLRESIVLASGMSLFIAPDSSFIHIAGSLGVPVIGLYGCFPSLLRMRYYKNSIGIDASVPCAPSFIHGHSPCYKGDPSPCFSVISIGDIMNAIKHLSNDLKIQNEYPVYNEFRNGELFFSSFIRGMEDDKRTT